MATIRLKKRASSGATGAPSSLAPSEVAFNEADKVLYYGYGDSGDGTSSSIISVAGEGAVMHLGNVNQTAAGNKTFSGNVVVSGDLTVNGTTTTLNTTNSAVKDALIELGTGTTGTPANDAGLVIERGAGSNAFIGWDESVDKFTIGTGTFTGASTGNLTITTGTLVGNLEGNVNGNLTGNVTGNTSGSAGSFTAGSASNLNSGTIPNARIAADSITESQLDIHNAPSGTSKVLGYTSNGLEWVVQSGSGGVDDGAITTAKLAADAVTGAKIADDAINSEHYTDGSIDTAHIATGAITGSRIGVNQVENQHYADLSIDTAFIKDNQITNAKMADDAIGLPELSATGTASSSTFLRGDNTWGTPTDTNTTYSAGTGLSLSGTTFTVDTLNQNTTGNAATATLASTVTVADESSDTSCNLLFATGATGSLAPKSGSNLTFNSSTGALTATSFVGVMDGGTF